MIDKGVFVLRDALLSEIRSFFKEEGFIEVDTPFIVPYENPDDNVENVKVLFSDFKGKEFLFFLHTSPEFFMKRLIWYGFDRIFQIARVFRNQEIGDSHNLEFTMVEWYRAGKDYTCGMDETERMVKHCFSKAETLGFKIDVDLTGSFLKLTVDEVFREFADVKDVLDEEEVKKVAGREVYEDAFFFLLVDKIEPALSQIKKPLFLYDFPEKFSAMAKVKDRKAERFELYIKGIEIANGYTELVGYKDYLEKFDKKGKRAVDKGFLKLLKNKPLPDCEGVALGFDRLLMAIKGGKISDVIPFTTDELIREVEDWKG
ncbi:amino acid--tRNA ligase-related protein [Desulfurobacterium atlanticum]|uniref:Lysyl-tRNA synthetase, class 2 n=1 Tax=Desulfurobacterium atlanticum TaxID=240169 RepID=A0A238Y959_9BACT|nr:amino acid--tRNA ligase-related protein [Desulfurobacterium atlanticum]SNR67153.1 lysyl-tRNA synthetase, class 2 [Desulfurobacterium atlanticum]